MGVQIVCTRRAVLKSEFSCPRIEFDGAGELWTYIVANRPSDFCGAVVWKRRRCWRDRDRSTIVERGSAEFERRRRAIEREEVIQLPHSRAESLLLTVLAIAVVIFGIYVALL